MTAAAQDAAPLMRKEFAAAKACWTGVFVVQCLGLVVAIAAVVVGNQAALALSTLGFLVPVLTAFLRSRAGTFHGRGEELRKALLLADGLGSKVDGGLVLVRIAHAPMVTGWDTPPLGSYFNSQLAPGVGRVTQILQQSAFFTARHAGTAFWLCVVPSLLIGTSGAFLIWAVAQGAEPFARATDIGAALLAFVVGGELLSTGLAFQQLAHVAAATVVTCSALLRDAKHEPADLMLALSAYDCAVAQAPPIPSSLYLLHRSRLEEAWATYTRQ